MEKYLKENFFKKCEIILKDAFTPKNISALAKFVFKIFNNRGIFVTEYKVIKIKRMTFEYLDLRNLNQNCM